MTFTDDRTQQHSQPLRPGIDPTRVGPYETLRRLGGSFGGCSVYLARRDGSPTPGELVALKILPIDAPDDVWLRFHREGTYADKISSPYVAEIRAAGADQHYRFLAQEFVVGPTLAQELAVRHGPLPLAECLQLGDGLLRGLAAIHAAGLLHRDIKPQNIILAHDRPVIVDLGIAKMVGEDSLTQTNQALGSYRFMSPEQAQGRELTEATDLYSWALVMAAASSGIHPADPSGTNQELIILENIRTGRLDLGAVPPRLIKILTAVLLVDPGRRPPLAALIDDLRTVAPSTGVAVGSTAALPARPHAAPGIGPLQIGALRIGSLQIGALRIGSLQIGGRRIGTLRELQEELVGNDLLFAGVVLGAALSGLLTGTALAALLP